MLTYWIFPTRYAHTPIWMCEICGRYYIQCTPLNVLSTSIYTLYTINLFQRIEDAKWCFSYTFRD